MMNQPVLFAEVVEAAEQLDEASQAELVEILKRRLAERGRERIAASIDEARREFAAGQCRVVTPAELIREATS
jgi:16S rRNA C1402 N4-methylase RsmH